MRVNDAIIGAVLLVLSLAVLWHVQSFPSVPGQPYGAALYPGLVSVGLALASVGLIVQGLSSGGPALVAGALSRQGLIAFITTIATLLFYILFVDGLGFIVCSILMLIALMWSYRARPVLILPVAIIATLVTHTMFYRFLKVPLPWGILQPVAW